MCVTRTSFSWGIQVPSDPKHVIYVWLDALTNYITALGYGSDNEELYNKFWPADLHIVGKDIARFHLIYWPIFLMALDIPLPKTILVHNWFTMKDGKMSKSKGNVIYPEQLMDRYGLDAMKYFLLREIPVATDGVFSPEEFVERYNSDLCNDLSNLLNRTVSMINKYFEGNVPKYNGTPNDVDEELEKEAEKTIATFEKYMGNYEIANAIQSIWNFVSRTNKYIDEVQPWSLAKDTNEPDLKNKNYEKLKSAMYHLTANLRQIAIMIRPFMENTSNEILRQLGIGNNTKGASLKNTEQHTKQSIEIDNDVNWGMLKNYKDLENLKVIEKGEPIFMRLNQNEEVEYIKGLMKK